MSRMFVLSAWALTALVVFLTLGPVADRPQFGHPQLERFAAFFLLAGAWSLALPGRRLWAALGLTLAAVLLEWGQAFVPHRDPGLIDAISKMAGAIFGTLSVSAIQAFGSRPAPSRG